MKQIVFIIFLSLIFVLNFKAQDSLTFNELFPYIDWLTKLEEKNRNIECILGGVYFNEKLKADLKIETKSLQNGENILVVEVQTLSRDLIFRERGNSLISETRFFGRITSKNRNFDKVFEEIIEIPITLEQMSKIFPVVYRRAIKLPKDKYTINFVVNSVDTEHKATKKFKFEIK